MKTCSICNKKHYAKGYCQGHYNNLFAGRQIQPKKCKFCDSKVSLHINEQLCYHHYAEYWRKLHPKYKKDGGEWGYKDYRTIQKYKKAYCEMCNSKEKLNLHHKDENIKNSKNTNLQTLCGKCHKQLHSKYKKIYGKTLKEMSVENGISISTIRWRIKKHKNLLFQKRKGNHENS